MGCGRGRDGIRRVQGPHLVPQLSLGIRSEQKGVHFGTQAWQHGQRTLVHNTVSVWGTDCVHLRRRQSQIGEMGGGLKR